MKNLETMEATRVHVGRLDHGADLLDELTLFCARNTITTASVEAIGAVQKARIGYYDQQQREYLYNEIDQPMEITKLVGNVSIKDGDPMVHAHITLADRQGRCFGGHLAQGTVIFACEVIIRELAGPQLIRQYDEETGLYLWEE